MRHKDNRRGHGGFKGGGFGGGRREDFREGERERGREGNEGRERRDGRAGGRGERDHERRVGRFEERTSGGAAARRHDDRRFERARDGAPRAAEGAGAEHRGARGVDAAMLIGRNAVREVARYASERLVRVYVVRREVAQGGDYHEILNLLKEKNVNVKFVTADELFELVGTESHQSFAAELKPRQGKDIKVFAQEMEKRETGLVLMLDSVQDPQNLGSILRSAECFAADAVIWSKNRGIGLTAAGRKASVGASELVECVEVSNLVDAIKKLKDSGFWVVAAEAREGAVEVEGFDFPPKTAIIMGSEGEGIHQLASKNADFRVKIPIYGKIDSLNVSQAVAVLLHSYRRQHKPRA